MSATPPSQGDDIGVGRVKLELPRLDLGEVQHIVDDIQKGTPRRVDAGHILRLDRAQRRVPEKIREADHSVQGRAEFVAHVGEEVGLCLIGSLRRVLGGTEGFFLFLLRREIPGDDVGPPESSLVVVKK